MGHARSGTLHVCPVMVLAELSLLLCKHGAPHDAPLGTYRKIPSGPLCYINSSNITKALKSAARVHEAEFGIGPDDVSAGCLRSTGAIALFCGSVDSSHIRLLGRWQSWTMLRYLHLQSRAAMRDLSAAMLQGGKIVILPPRQPTFSFPRASRRPSMHHSNLQ